MFRNNPARPSSRVSHHLAVFLSTPSPDGIKACGLAEIKRNRRYFTDHCILRRH